MSQKRQKHRVRKQAGVCQSLGLRGRLNKESWCANLSGMPDCSVQIAGGCMTKHLPNPKTIPKAGELAARQADQCDCREIPLSVCAPVISNDRTKGTDALVLYTVGMSSDRCCRGQCPPGCSPEARMGMQVKGGGNDRNAP